MIAWTIEDALSTPQIGRVIVSTDDADIAEVARQYGVDVPFVRPAEFATDEAPTEPVLIHAIEWLREHEGYVPDAVVLLQPTSPLRSSGAIGRAIEQYVTEGSDCLVSTVEIHPFLWQNPNIPQALYDISRRPRRQDFKPEERMYEENGSIYVTRTSLLLSRQSRLIDGKISMFVMNKEESIDVDTPADFAMIEFLLTKDIIG